MDEKINKLTFEMGFSRAEAIMALTETNGNMDNAIENLLQQKYAPPPYSSTNVSSSDKNIECPDQNSFSSENLSKSSSQETNFSPDKIPFDFIKNIPAEFVLPCLPPPYQKVDTMNKVKDWEDESKLFHITENTERNPHTDISKYYQKRCNVCFNEILTLADDGTKHIEEIVQHKMNYFHYSCFTKKFGPKCAYCCFPLFLPDKDHEISGQYLVYKDRDYHVECYTKYAGPRCSYCCNVIVEVPGGEYSGKRIIDGLKEYHVECYNKKVYAIWRAKNS
ncbi:uncharacterized protein LOC105850927 [Hydra vulgaris]|uniref:Uncharacterized protein LOC105850927 n=1 Tax=Hydra vulgaris TaxID=6087 RepID=A0ABM4D3S3_HYDVU